MMSPVPLPSPIITTFNGRQLLYLVDEIRFETTSGLCPLIIVRPVSEILHVRRKLLAKPPIPPCLCNLPSGSLFTVNEQANGPQSYHQRSIRPCKLQVQGLRLNAMGLPAPKPPGLSFQKMSTNQGPAHMSGKLQDL